MPSLPQFQFKIRVPGSLSGAPETDIVIQVHRGTDSEALASDLAGAASEMTRKRGGPGDEDIVRLLRANAAVLGLIATTDDAEHAPEMHEPVVVPLHTLCADPATASRAVRAVGGVCRLIVRGIEGGGLGAKRSIAATSSSEAAEWYE